MKNLLSYSTSFLSFYMSSANQFFLSGKDPPSQLSYCPTATMLQVRHTRHSSTHTQEEQVQEVKKLPQRGMGASWGEQAHQVERKGSKFAPCLCLENNV